MESHQTFKQLASSGSQKSVNTEDFSLFQVQAYVVQSPATAFFRKTHVLDLQHLRLFGKVDASLETVILGVLSNHVFYDPAELNVFYISVCNVFSITENSDVVTDLHNFLETMGNIYDGNSGLQKLSHDLEKNLNLCCGKRGGRLIHDQHT